MAFQSSPEPKVVDDSWPQMQHLGGDLLENMPGPRNSGTLSAFRDQIEKVPGNAFSPVVR